MENGMQYICPRPRSSRACDKCRSRKTRCLPDKNPSRNACRRCASFGYSCTFTTTTPSAKRKHQPSKVQAHEKHKGSLDDNDIISSLFKTQPIVQKDESEQVFDFHRRVFHQKTVQSPVTERRGAQAMEPPSANYRTPVLEPGSDDITITISKADEFISLFKRRRRYFPFVEIPGNHSAASMAAYQPFLLLAILTVSSSRNPGLQRRTDERFRRVLSDKVIVQGEKSLDYVQGLLVYIAWCPLHLRPMNNQLFQFLQIATTMIYDLKLPQEINNKASRNACLGCYNLSSLLSIGMQRASDNAAEIYRKTMFDSDVISNIQGESTVKYSELQMLFEEVSRAERECNFHGNGDLKVVQETIAFWSSKLTLLETAVLPDDDDKIPIRLFQLFLKARIAFLPFQPPHSDPKHTIPTGSPLVSAFPDCETIKFAISCFAEIQIFLEFLLSIHHDQYIDFSTREWCLLILTITLASRICLRSCVINSLEWDNFRANARIKMVIYLESLTNRMEKLSTSRISKHPDFFFMFKSVLEIVSPSYSPPKDAGSSRLSDDTVTEGSVSFYPTDERMEGPLGGITRCPVVNGGIRRTDFWQALGQSTGPLHDDLGSLVENEEFNVDEGIMFGNLVDESEDWPNMFSEWVNDFGNIY